MITTAEFLDEDLEELKRMMPGFVWTAIPEPPLPPGYFRVIDALCIKAGLPLGTVVDYDGFRELFRRIPVDWSLGVPPKKRSRPKKKWRQRSGANG